MNAALYLDAIAANEALLRATIETRRRELRELELELAALELTRRVIERADSERGRDA
jgi:hypothetical protein